MIVIGNLIICFPRFEFCSSTPESILHSFPFCNLHKISDRPEPGADTDTDTDTEAEDKGEIPLSLDKLKELAKLVKPAGVSYNKKGLADAYYEYIIQLAISKFANSFKMEDQQLTYDKKILPYTKSLLEGLKNRSVKHMRAALAAMVDVCSKEASSTSSIT